MRYQRIASRPTVAHGRLALLRGLAALGMAAVALAFLSSSAVARKQVEPAADKTLSPYFIVKSSDPKTDRLPLKSTEADVAISGVIARVKVTQTYKNEGDSALEAIYVFPGSTRSAVFGMRMTIGDRTITAKINKKEEARKLYDAAKAAGKTASLLEQKRPNVFQMNVANIMPGDTIQVELDYTELLVPEGGTYELSYPSVVGPRFTGEADGGEAKKDAWTAQGYTKEGVAAAFDWDMKVRIDGGIAIKRVTSPSHKIDVNGLGTQVATVKHAGSSNGGNRDFVLRYQLSGKQIETGMLLFPGVDGEDGFFLTMVQPPTKVAAADRPNREYVFILDVSGSMRGFPLQTAKKTIEPLLKGLRQGDRFNIMFFSGGNLVMAPRSVPATRANIAEALGMVDAARGGGGTRILNALRQALDMPAADGMSRTFVAVTDGYVSVEPAVFELIRQNLGEANMFTFGIGSSVNRHLIEGMARAGMGEPFIVLHGDDAAEQAAKFEKYIGSPALTDIKVSFEGGFDAYDVEPMSVPDLFAQRPVVVFGKYRGAARGRVKVTGVSGRGSFTKSLDVASYQPSSDNVALRYLWARHRIARLGDLERLRKDDARVAQITTLGLKYSLMTEYTSFVAVDDAVRNQTGESTTVKQPLPLPQGVPNSAIASGSKKMMRGRPGSYGKLAMGGASRAFAPSPSPARDRAEPAAERKPKPATPDVVGMISASVMGLNVGGTLDAIQVEKSLRRRLNVLKRCGVRVGSLLQFKLTIGRDGKVTAVVLRSAARTSPNAQACVKKALKATRFPNTAAGGEATFSLKFAR